MKASLKHFESDCFITEGVCTFDTRYKCREASKASFKTQARSGPVSLSTLFHNSYLGGPLKTNSTTSRPIRRQNNSRRCVKSAVYLLNLKINFFLLSRTFLPVDIANKTTEQLCFQLIRYVFKANLSISSEHYCRINITAAQHDDGTE